MAKNERLIRIFDYALQQEKAGKGFFEDSMRRMAMGTAGKALLMLSRREEEHAQFFKAFKDRLTRVFSMM